MLTSAISTLSWNELAELRVNSSRGVQVDGGA
jgi:hypothetical protein